MTANRLTESAKSELPGRLLHMAEIAKRARLNNLAENLVVAAQEVASMMWELQVLKQKKRRSK